MNITFIPFLGPNLVHVMVYVTYALLVDVYLSVICMNLSQEMGLVRHVISAARKGVSTTRLVLKMEPVTRAVKLATVQILISVLAAGVEHSYTIKRLELGQHANVKKTISAQPMLARKTAMKAVMSAETLAQTTVYAVKRTII